MMYINYYINTNDVYQLLHKSDLFQEIRRWCSLLVIGEASGLLLRELGPVRDGARQVRRGRMAVVILGKNMGNTLENGILGDLSLLDSFIDLTWLLG